MSNVVVDPTPAPVPDVTAAPASGAPYQWSGPEPALSASATELPPVLERVAAALPVVLQTPWYRNPVVWTTYLVHAIAIFFLLSPLIVSYPGVPAGAISAIGAITIVLNQLGYQSHSATVRAAELGAAQPADLTKLVGS